MKTTPEFTDAEIQEIMDFKQVLTLTEEAQGRSKKLIRRIVTTALITGLVGGGWWVYQPYSSPESIRQIEAPGNTGPEAKVLPDTTLQSDNPNRKVDSLKKPAQTPLTARKKKETSSAIRVDSVKSVFLPAEPTDGYPALYDYFAKELRYPKEAIKDSIQGVILISFVINTQGKPEQVMTDHLLGEAFEKEAIRLIEHMPTWRPAQLDGSPVNSKVSVPITFSVKTIKNLHQ